MCHFPNTSSVWTLESVHYRCFNSSPFCRQGYVCISVCLNVDVSDCSMDTFWIHAFAHYVVHSLHEHAVIHAFKCMIYIQHTRYRPIIVIDPYCIDPLFVSRKPYSKQITKVWIDNNFTNYELSSILLGAYTCQWRSTLKENINMYPLVL